MRPARLKQEAVILAPQERAGVLLPLPLAGAYDYKLPRGVNAPRGTVVAAPLGNRESLGVVWGSAEGTVGDNRLKVAVPLDGAPVLPAGLCDFIDWVADYTINPPGAILAMALRSRGAFEPESLRTAYVKGDVVPAKLSEGRKRVLAVAQDGAGAQRVGPGGRRQCLARGGAGTDRGGRLGDNPIAGVRGLPIARSSFRCARPE